MSRIAIGYEATDDLDRPVVVFIEMDDGVLVQRRGEPAPRRVTTPVDLPPEAGRREHIDPGSVEYFDAVLDAFATNVVIRAVGEEPELVASLLVSENVWEALPKPQVALPA